MQPVDAVYARQSIDKADSISIESQIEFCKFETRGAPFRVFQDRGYSGKNTQRPEFQQLMAAVRRREVRRVICYKLDRISRSILDFANLMEEFQRWGVEFVSCTEKFDTASPMGRAMLNICVVFAQLERETIQQRVTDAYHARNKRGFYMGGRVPFGFRLEPCQIEGKRTSRYVCVPEEAELLRRMYVRYAQPRSSLGDVARELTEGAAENPGRSDGRWTGSRIGRLLENPIYVRADLAVYEYFLAQGVEIHNGPGDFIGTNGCYLYTEKDRDGGRSRHLVLAPHEGLVPAAVWLQCRQKHIGAGETGRQYRIKNTWLAGKIKCAKCGYALVARKTVKPGGRVFRYLVCSEAGRGAGGCEGLHGVRAEEAEGLVLAQIGKKLLSLPPLLPPRETARTPELRALKLRLASLDREIAQTAQAAAKADGALLRHLGDRAAALEEGRRSCVQALRQLEAETARDMAQGLRAADCLAVWDRMSLEDRMGVADALIRRIDLSETEMTVTWKL